MPCLIHVALARCLSSKLFDQYSPYGNAFVCASGLGSRLTIFTCRGVGDVWSGWGLFDAIASARSFFFCVSFKLQEHVAKLCLGVIGLSPNFAQFCQKAHVHILSHALFMQVAVEFC